MKKLGKLKYIDDLRTVWPNEAKDFIPWLAEEENIALLGEALNIDISVEETESSVGGYSLDILAIEDGTDNKIIIENELEETDHKHLGQLLTYASGKDAKIVVWVVKKARDEHKNAIEWLNNHTDYDVSFFLVEVKLVSIDGSEPAVVFDVVEEPNDWQKETKKVKIELNETRQFKLEYWTQFVEYAFQNQEFSRLFGKRKPRPQHWYSVSMGSSDYHLNMNLNTVKNKNYVEIYIRDNKDLFHSFYEHKDEIEQIIGGKLDWRELPDKMASRIVIACPTKIKDESKRKEQFDWMIQTAIKFYKAFKKFE